MRQRKTYIFRHPTFGWEPELVVTRRGHTVHTLQPTEATYDRFRALAHSGDYLVEIQDYGWSVAWSLRRKLSPDVWGTGEEG